MLGTYNDVELANQRARRYVAENITNFADYEEVRDRATDDWDAVTRSLESGKRIERYDLDGTLRLGFQYQDIGQDLVTVSRQVIEGNALTAPSAPGPTQSDLTTYTHEAGPSASNSTLTHVYVVLNRQQHAYGDDLTFVHGVYTSVDVANRMAEKLWSNEWDEDADDSDGQDGVPREVDENDLWPEPGDMDLTLRFRTRNGEMRFCLKDVDGESTNWYCVQRKKLN